VAEFRDYGRCAGIAPIIALNDDSLLLCTVVERSHSRELPMRQWLLLSLAAQHSLLPESKFSNPEPFGPALSLQ
jgi:hypothetical protein